MIYLASPYSHPSQLVMRQRYNKVSKLTAKLISAGHVVFCPIAYSHPLAVKFKLAGDFAFWEKMDKEFINRCDGLWVYQLEGWDKSKGVKAEVSYALEIGKLVSLVTESGIPQPYLIGLQRIERSQTL